MFIGQAEEAMNFYVSTFDRSEIVSIQRYGPNESGTEGSVMLATFVLKGQTFRCIDSNIEHAFTFTPSVSFFVTCETDEEVDRLYERLSSGGQVLMPLGEYPFSRKYCWVADKYGVPWQLAVRE